MDLTIESEQAEGTTIYVNNLHCIVEQCPCSFEEEDSAVTNVILKYGKTYELSVEVCDKATNFQQLLLNQTVDVRDGQNHVKTVMAQCEEQDAKKKRNRRGGKPKTVTQQQRQPIISAMHSKKTVRVGESSLIKAITQSDVSTQFQQAVNDCESRIEKLVLDVNKLKQAQSQGKNNPNRIEENLQQITTLESKIEELEMQKNNALFGFDRAMSCIDVEVRQKRELFRLTSPLPALAKRQDFEKAVIENQFVVVMGQTGSGKSTQLTQYLADMPQFANQIVICTQPRKIAALTLTQRVAFEFAAGNQTIESKKWVGCQVGGENRLQVENRIRYMTETVLLNQLTQAEVTRQDDPFRKCCAVIVDEAHSRTVTTDVLLGVLKRKIHLWPHLKVIVTSATIDTNLFSKYLQDCPVIEIPGRLFPVQVLYRPFDRESGKIVDAVVNQAIAICNEHESGDILCFLTGQNEVEWAKQKFAFKIKPKASRNNRIVAYCLYGRQTPEEQQQIFIKTPDVQKVIFSTDIAETSVTIDGVKFIVDSGLTKNLVFDSARNIASLKEMMISSASAEQRKGRAGRTGPGTCYRMYSEEEYNALEKYDKPEILLRPLSITVTLLKAMRVDPLNFDWLENPDVAALEAAIQELHLLGAIDHLQNLTPLGHLISDLQIDPGIAHMIYYACSKELGKISTILAGLFSITRMVFWRGGEDETRKSSDESKKKFYSNLGDILTCYQAFTGWYDKKKADSSMKTAKAWCMENYINNKAMSMAWSTANEIESHLKRNAHHIWRKSNQDREATPEELQQLIAQAFVLNVAYKVNKNYVALRADVMTYIHPGSVFFREKELPQVVTYQEILRTSKTYALQLTPIDMEWIQQENGALHALYEEMASQVNICEVRVTPVSRGILRNILGPANRNVDELNRELDCLIHGDYDKDALVAWCKPNACNFVYSELTRRVHIRKSELEMEIREDPIVGETRVVWGYGGEARYLLFSGDYIAINIRNVPNSWNLSDINYTIGQKLSRPIKDSIRNLFFLPRVEDQRKKIARIAFDDAQNAAAALQELSKGGIRGGLEISPFLTNRPSAYKESEAWLDISFAIAPSKNSVIIMYDSMDDANRTIKSGCLNFKPSRFKENSKFNPTVNFDLFVQTPNPFNVKMSYVLYAGRLPIFFDETDVEKALVNYNCPPPSFTKIVRGDSMQFPNESNTEFSRDPSDDVLLKYAQNNELLPFPDKILRTFVRRNKAQKKVTIRAKYESMDQIERIYVSKLCRNAHCDQPVRLNGQLKTSLRLEKSLWEFRRKDIQTYLSSLKMGKVFYKIETKQPTNIWLHLDVPRAENLEEVRKKIDDFLQFRFYKNSNTHLLFTQYGLKQLSVLDAKPGYLNFTVAAKKIRIYGNETERKVVEDKLNQLVENLRVLLLDVPLIISKNSLKVVEKNLNIYRNPGLCDDLRLSYNRLYVSGTEEGIEMLKTTLKEHIIEPRGEIDIGDCGVCFSPIENPISLQLCAHKFCTDCLKAMANQEIVPYPIICPADGCGVKLCLKDIQEIASSSVLEKVSQSAVAALRDKFADKYRTCFKVGCEQFLPMPSKHLEGIDQLSSGGNTVYCDQCNLHYCSTCSVTMKKPIERHRGSTCSQRQSMENKDSSWHRLYILDEICLLRCPRCRTAFVDFDGCCALYCSMERCKAGFCFFCLEDCGRDAHNHVLGCTKNPCRGGYFIKASQKNTVHKESRKSAIVQYLMKTTDRELRSAVLHSIVQDLKDLEIVINPSEVGLQGFAPISETSKHRQYILDEICTLHCPRCRTAFFDFEGCSALTCGVNTCKTMFCFFCLEDCGKDDQKCSAHVIKCPKNIQPGQLYTPDDLIEEVNRQRCKMEVIKYLMSNCSDLTERLAVIDSVSFQLKQLNVTIDSQDLKPPPPPPVVQLPVERDRDQLRYEDQRFQAQRPNPIGPDGYDPYPVRAVPARPIQPIQRDPYPVRAVPARPIQPIQRDPYPVRAVPARPIQPIQLDPYPVRAVPARPIQPIQFDPYPIRAVPARPIQPIQLDPYPVRAVPAVPVQPRREPNRRQQEDNKCVFL